MVSLSLEQLTQASSYIVQAQMVSQVARWNAAHTTIITVSTWKVSQVYKGNPPSTLEVQQPGGTVGNINVYVSGVATLKPQSDYVLFLEPAPDGSSPYSLVGLMQGAFRVYDDATTQERRVILPFSGLQIQNQVLADGNPAGTVPLKSFAKYVAIARSQGIKIPTGLTLPVTIVSTESAGAGRLFVYGRTTAQLFPSKTLFIPSGSEVEGAAVLMAGKWMISWTDLDVRGVRAQISATSEESEGSLRGRSVVFNVR